MRFWGRAKLSGSVRYELVCGGLKARVELVAGARIRVDHVSRAYGTAVVLDDVSFDVEPGELVLLTGPSGSGKTTLLQLIGSLDQPTTGRILVDDVSVGELSHPAAFRRATVGFVFQLHYLLPALSAQDNVELPMRSEEHTS